ncbi:MAG: hypothetical protein J6A80_06900 [Lachnospiraceae bacterium]|nr:hypothetical protein [Lachnospiraceae bacterium]
MKKLLVMMLVSAMSMAMLTGCNADANGAEDGQNAEGASDVIAEEVVSMDETQESETAETEVSEEVSEMTLEEKILAEMPAKLEVGEDEIIVPEAVTADQIMTRMEEVAITVDENQNAEMINDMNMAGMLVLNCSYMEPAEFNTLVNEHFGSMDEMWANYNDYITYLTDGSVVYGSNVIVAPERLLFDEYLINQSEQITYLVGMYQTDTENSMEYYEMIMDYLAYDENNLFTFDSNDSRLEGSGLVCLQYAALRSLMNDIIEYDTDLYINDNIFTTTDTEIWNIVNEHSNQMSR